MQSCYKDTSGLKPNIHVHYNNDVSVLIC